jgi:hypothetical protein
MSENLPLPIPGTLEHDMYSRMQAPHGVAPKPEAPQTIEEDMAMRFPTVEASVESLHAPEIVPELATPPEEIPESQDPYARDMSMRFPALEATLRHPIAEDEERLLPVLAPIDTNEAVLPSPDPVEPTVESRTRTRTPEKEQEYLEARQRLAEHLGLKGDAVERLGSVRNFPDLPEIEAPEVSSIPAGPDVETIEEDSVDEEITDTDTEPTAVVTPDEVDGISLPRKENFREKVRRSRRERRATRVHAKAAPSKSKASKSRTQRIREIDREARSEVGHHLHALDKTKDKNAKFRMMQKGPFENNSIKERLKRRGARMVVSVVGDKVSSTAKQRDRVKDVTGVSDVLSSPYWVKKEHEIRFKPGAGYVWPRRIGKAVIRYNRFKDSRAAKRASS